MTEVIFFIAGTGAIGGAIGVVALRNPFYSVLALVAHLLSLAALFLLLRAEFVAAAQVVVYAGAVMVLYVFVVAYVGRAEEPIQTPGPALGIAAPLCAGLVAVELCIAMLGSGLKGIGHEGAPYAAGFGSPAQIGELLLTKFLLAFEVASYLLLVAAVGAVVLARRRRGLPEERPDFALSLPPQIGTMVEGVGAPPDAPVRGAAGATPRSEEVLEKRGGW
jgi:NADH:ubiquinone oxidoreductase subunit 6 (subunit J)